MTQFKTCVWCKDSIDKVCSCSRSDLGHSWDFILSKYHFGKIMTDGSSLLKLIYSDFISNKTKLDILYKI